MWQKSEVKKNGSLDNPSEYYDRTSQSGSLSVEDENSDITLENEMGTENTDDYEDDNFSALSENIEDELQSVQSGNSSAGSSGITAAAGTATTTSNSCTVPTTRSHTSTAAPPLTTRSVSSSAVGSGVGKSMTGNSSRHRLISTKDRNQNLQNVAAAVYNYHAVTKEVGHEYLNDIYTEEDEKVYEDLCYVTFSSKVSEVCIKYN